MTRFNEPVVFTSLTIQFRVFKIRSMKENRGYKKLKERCQNTFTRSRFKKKKKKASLAAGHARCKVQSNMFVNICESGKKRNVSLDKEEDFHLVLSILTCFYFAFFFSDIINLTYYRKVGE